MILDRREILRTGALGALAAAVMGCGAEVAFARAATSRRFVFIIQRGAADGLSILAPTGDPAFAGVRRDLAADAAKGTRLDAMFTLHPDLKTGAELYRGGNLLLAHAVASPYRERSHFDGQNVLETGGNRAYQLRDGWLNRLLTLLPRDEARGVAYSATIPMALRGDANVASYAPSRLPEASDDLLAKVSMLYAGDPQLSRLWNEALSTRELAGDLGSDGGRSAAATGSIVARLLSPEDGARIAMIETSGWDTHAQQRGRMSGQMVGLDAMIGALRDGLGPIWRDTLVLVATEFGRTVAINGTGGTDHGTGSLAMLAGGAVRGGRILSDWPGLAPAQLYENRDLKPTTPLDDLIVGALTDHFALDPTRLRATLFPQAPTGKPMRDLIV